MRILPQRLPATRQQESGSDAAVILLLSYSILAFLVFLFCFNFPPARSHLPSFLCPTSSLTLPTSPPLYFSLRAGVRSGRATRPPAPQSHWLLYALFDSVSFCNTCSLSFTPRLQRSWIITVSYKKRRECRGWSPSYRPSRCRRRCRTVMSILPTVRPKPFSSHPFILPEGRAASSSFALEWVGNGQNAEGGLDGSFSLSRWCCSS